jgi:hypothetical protein
MSNDEVMGKVIPALQLIAYQKGAIVSRTLVDSDPGTITLSMPWFIYSKDKQS